MFDFPEENRRRVRTSNLLERVSQEIKRGTRVVQIFPNQAAFLRLASAVLMEISDQTCFCWRRVYGGIDVTQTKKLKAVEKENTRLKKLVADLSLENAILKELGA